MYHNIIINTEHEQEGGGRKKGSEGGREGEREGGRRAGRGKIPTPDPLYDNIHRHSNFT